MKALYRKAKGNIQTVGIFSLLSNTILFLPSDFYIPEYYLYY
jgi:hypothetical protein